MMHWSPPGCIHDFIASVLEALVHTTKRREKELNTRGILRAWGRILAGRTPSLSVEVTQECPLSCPGCYFHEANHLGRGGSAAGLNDCKGEELVGGVMALVIKFRPLHVSLVGGEPLVRYRELSLLLPLLAAAGVHTQVVTSAVRPIPSHWSEINGVDIVVSVDGLQPEHDARRKPATYDRIEEHIWGHRVIVHCTITRQMTERDGYLREFVRLWSGKQGVRKIWVSLYTPQNGEDSEEVLSSERRNAVIDDLLLLRKDFPKLDLPEGLVLSYRFPPMSPADCVFAKTTTAVASDLRTHVTPCPLGGDPDCSQCGCMGYAGLDAVRRHRLPVIGLRVGKVYDSSYAVGRLVAGLRQRIGALHIPNGVKSN